MTVINKNDATRAGLLISYYLVLSFWAAQTLSMTLITRNIAGQTKKTVVIAANFVAWAAGNAAGQPPFFIISMLRSLTFHRHTSFSQLGCTPLFHCILYPHGLLCPSCYSSHLPAVVFDEPECEEGSSAS